MKKLHIILLSFIIMGIGIESLEAGKKKKKRRKAAKAALLANAVTPQSGIIVDSKKNNQEISSQQQSFIDQFKTLASSGVENITNDQIAAISISIIPFISNNQIVQFTPTQIVAFTPEQISVFSPAQITALTINQMVVITAEQVAAFTSAQISTMSIFQLEEILPDFSELQIQSMVMSQIQNLSNLSLTEYLNNFSAEQIKEITPVQLIELATTITPRISDLSPAQFLSLSQDQIQTITNQNITDHIGYISPMQMGYLLAEQIALITVDQINLMNTNQLNALQAILQNPSIITTTNNPNLTVQLNAIYAAPGTGIILTTKKRHKASSDTDKNGNVSFTDFFTGQKSTNGKLTQGEEAYAANWGKKKSKMNKFFTKGKI